MLPSLLPAAGFSAWTNAAYGPFVSFMCSFMSWLSGVTDNAIYPVMVLEYLSEGSTGVDRWGLLEQWAFVLGFTAVFTYLTYRGLDVTGGMAIFLTAFVLAPFVVFTIMGSAKVNPTNWLKGPRAGKPVKWKSLLNILFWNLNYYDSASAFAGDCKEVSRTPPLTPPSSRPNHNFKPDPNHPHPALITNLNPILTPQPHPHSTA